MDTRGILIGSSVFAGSGRETTLLRNPQEEEGHGVYIASYLSKVVDFNPPHVHLAPRGGRPRSKFVEIFGTRKLESLGYHVVLFV